MPDNQSLYERLGGVFAIATVVVSGSVWWRNASQVSALVLKEVFCERRDCRPEHASRWVRSRSLSVSAASPTVDPKPQGQVVPN